MGGIKVVLIAEDPSRRGQSSGDVAARSKTDDAGVYSFNDLTPAHYWVVPIAPAAVLQGGDGMTFEEGKSVLLDNGQQATGVDLSLQPGGVVGGRVLDASNQPLAGLSISLERLDESGNLSPYWSVRTLNVTTDDRGIYRAYGIPAGRYRVSTGGDQPSLSQAVHFAKTYAPGVTNTATAAIVEVQPGAESLNVDIALGSGSKTYSASGRFVESDTGQSVPYVRYWYGHVQAGGSTSIAGQGADSKGQFKLQGLSPGHYQVTVSQDDSTGYVAESTGFDVADSDVTGVEVKVSRGGSVSGTITLENANGDSSSTAGISSLSLFAVDFPHQTGMATVRQLSPASDGSFQVTSLVAGSVQFQLRPGSPEQSGYRVVRVELNGTVLPPRGIEVAPGQQVTGVNVIVAYGTGSIRGSVTIGGPPLPEEARLFVTARKISGTPGAQQLSATIDSVGHFQIDSVPDGDYELSLQGFAQRQGRLSFKGPGPTVSVAGGQTVNVNIETEYQPQPSKQ